MTGSEFMAEAHGCKLDHIILLHTKTHPDQSSAAVLLGTDLPAGGLPAAPLVGRGF